jgi:hypothetical protein
MREGNKALYMYRLQHMSRFTINDAGLAPDRTMAGCFGFVCRADQSTLSLSHAAEGVLALALCHSLRDALARLGILEGRAHVHVKLVSCLLSAATLIIVVTHCKRVEEAYTRYTCLHRWDRASHHPAYSISSSSALLLNRLPQLSQS